MLEDLVDKENPTTMIAKLRDKLHQRMVAEVEVVHVHIEAGAVGAILLLGILQQESRLTYTPGSLDANHAVAPIYLIHQIPAHRGIEVLHQIGMCTIK